MQQNSAIQAAGGIYIGISKDYNVFELQRALTKRDVLKANRIVNYFAANPKKGPMPVVVSSLYNFFSKVYMLHFLRNLSDQEVLQALPERLATLTAGRRRKGGARAKRGERRDGLRAG